MSAVVAVEELCWIFVVVVLVALLLQTTRILNPPDAHRTIFARVFRHTLRQPSIELVHPFLRMRREIMPRLRQGVRHRSH